MTLPTYTRSRNTAFGLLLLTIGFLGGYFSGSSEPFSPAPRPAPAASMPNCHQARPDRWAQRANPEPVATVIIFQNGQPFRIDQAGLAQAAPPPPAGNRYGLLFALLALSALPAVTWAALAWSRRRSNPIAKPEFPQEFVPRRDD